MDNNTETLQPLRWHEEKRKVKDLLPHHKNPRKWRDKGREELDSSLFKFDQVAPSVINADGTLIDGHRRLEQMLAAGWGEREVDVRVPNRQLAPEEVAELMVRMNTHQGTWDFEGLQDDFFEGFDFEGMGLELEKVDGFKPEKVAEAVEDDYEIPQEIQTDIVQGDLFEFRHGEIVHRLLCGDSTDSDAVARLMDGRKADMVFTDPPHDIEEENFISYLDLFCKGVKFVLHNDKYLAMLAAKYIDRFERFFVHDFIFHIGGGNRFFTQNDLIACFDYNSDAYNNLQDGFSTVIRKMTERQKGTVNLPHPHAKPVYLVSQFISHFSKEMDLVLDLYGGSGTTMVTAHQLSRNCYMMELNEKTAQVILDRMKALADFEIYKNGEKIA